MTPHPDTVLLEIVLTPFRGPPTAWRVLGDGRYEERSSVRATLGADGQVREVAQEAVWRPVYTFTPAEMEQLMAALRAPALATLSSHYPRPPGTSEGSTLRWTLWADGQLRTVQVDGYPFNPVPALDQLYTLYSTLHAPPAMSSVWRVGAVERSVPCDVNAVPAFRPVLHALFSPGAVRVGADGSMAGEPLLEVAYQRAGVETTRCRLYPNGTFSCTKEGEERVSRVLTDDGVRDVRAALVTLDLASLKEPICP